ncbi:MAG: hypothetical protein KJ970_19805 [Candidatus Eisenbacteria bacterium]|uniref:WD40 repeat domain-containing protein n=1 Tax=Eiseniibacteriota bacterium TaxID=2212470 RepID=A0A948S0R0_UNCEI|nr:hypothetical protein [Candidatus Eisenbacteria bacterium]MBU1950085.1 hypothetical protein [Candidatus Eisenbacteria bacterium]MBU2693167.1 hypothetical protein [Candidatus Eisenbacteria bacterium]
MSHHVSANMDEFQGFGIKRAWGPGVFVLIGLLLLGSLPIDAVETLEFITSAEAEFLLGTSEGFGISSKDYLVLAPHTTTLAVNLAPYVWKLCQDPEGRIYAATGSDGILYRLNAEGEIEKEINSHEYEIFALTLDAKGRPIFAGAPNGTIQMWDNEEVRTLFDVPEGIVWTLVVGDDGTIYASTGERGRIYAIKQDGTAKYIYEAPETHIVSMAWGTGGRLIAGTDSQGLLLSIDPATGDSEVLYDAHQEEIAEILTLENGDIIFAANGGAAMGRKNDEEGVNEFSLNIRPAPEGPVVYRREASGLITDLWRCPEDDILSLAPAGEGSVWIGTGSNGVLYRIYPDGTSERTAVLEQNQILTLLSTDAGLLLGTGNGGGIYRLDGKGIVAGIYTSQVLDAGATSTWGTPFLNIELTPGAELSFLTRSGATSNVEAGWSEWSAIDRSAGAAINSPPNRFLQWKIVLNSSAVYGETGPKVYEVRTPYLRPNRPPRIRQIIVSPSEAMFTGGTSVRPGTVSQTLPGGVQIDYTFQEAANRTNSLPAAKLMGPWAKIYRSAVWEADDVDGDRLSYDISFRPVDDNEWTLLEEEVMEPAYTWDASAWPEGKYQIRVRATDLPGNPEQWSLETIAESHPFEIDHTPPALENVRAQSIVDQEGRAILVSGRAVDMSQRIAALEVSFDGKGWKSIAPSDGILDSRIESFSARISIGKDLPRFIAVRARDAIGHPAIARARLE